LEFKEIRAGEFWPPILPNGRFFAQTPESGVVQQILEVTDTGLECGGVSFNWGDITGFAIQGDQAVLLSQKYPSGGLKFMVGTCHYIGSGLSPQQYVNGYPVEYCLMNRVTFEQQRL
jgi:hypothetical protein